MAGRYKKWSLVERFLADFDGCATFFTTINVANLLFFFQELQSEMSSLFFLQLYFSLTVLPGKSRATTS